MKNLMMAVFLMVLAVNAAEPEAFNVVPPPGAEEVVVKAPAPGIYWFSTNTYSKVPVGVEHTAEFRWDDGPWRHRRLLNPNRAGGVYGIDRIEFTGEPRRLQFRFDREKTERMEFQFAPVQPVKVPKEAVNYKPPFAPPLSHPRLLVNPEALSQIRANLKTGVNATTWEKLSAEARKPFKFELDPDREVMYDPAVSLAISQKAFYYLMTGEREIGREATELSTTYLDVVSFGNGQDICRKVGEIIYRVSQAYDWCYELMTPDERTFLRQKMLYLAGEMEIGWPPFKESVVVGHGNESQVSRDLLAMAIAVYNEDPEPYRYVAYTMLEVFQPSRTYLYQSGRHDQGYGYGGYRMQYDLFAALQFKRTFGYDLLPAITAEVPYNWHYLRLPDNRFFVEGDGNWIWLERYYANRQLLLNSIALWPDAELKEEFRRSRTKLDFPEDPVFFLLVNDPNLKPEDRRAELPLTKFYKKPLPGMIARTGWNFGKQSDDVVVSMNGAYYHYRNHQHLDMGAFQIYYRGVLAADLGQYKNYGIPFDWNFAKSTVSHSAMLFRDPEQKTYRMGPQFTANSGTQEITGWWPADDLKEQTTGMKFRNGDTMRAGWGPDAVKPLYSFMETDLGILYPNRVKSYSRSFVFLNLGRPDTPAALLVLDRFEKSAERVEPLFQLTSIATPVEKGGAVEVAVSPYGRTGKLTMQTLLPAGASKRILTGKDAFTVDGTYFEPRIPAAPEANGSRTVITGGGKTFLNLIQIQDGAAAPLPVNQQEKDGRIVLEIADRQVNLGDALQPTGKAVSWTVTEKATQVLLLDLAPGAWELQANGKTISKAEVSAENGSFFAILEPGSYTLSPVEGK